MTFFRFAQTAALAAVTAFGAVQALAHSALVSSVPGKDQTVEVVPAVKLNFNEPVRMVRLSIVNDSDGKPVDIDFKAAASAQQAYEQVLPALAPGAYTVNWTLVGADGHTVNDRLSFNLAAGMSAHAEHVGHAEAETRSAGCEHCTGANHADHANHGDHRDHAGHAGHAGQGGHAGHGAAQTQSGGDHQH